MYLIKTNGVKSALTAVFLILFSSNVLALNIAYIDTRKLIDESPQGQAQLAELKQKFSQRNQEIKAKFEKLKSADADFQKNSVLMSAEEVEEKTAELKDMQREINSDQRNYNQAYNESGNSSLGKLHKIIYDAVVFIAERDEYDLILQQAIFVSSEVNLTKQVLEELKKRAAK